jgi:hypothetical protein
MAYQISNFADFVKARTIDVQFVTRNDESEILKEGLTHFNIEFDDARSLLLGKLVGEDVTLERELDGRVNTLLERIAEKRKITKRTFNETTDIYRRWTRNNMSQDDVKKKLKSIIDGNDWKVSRNGLLFSKRWYKKIKVD